MLFSVFESVPIGTSGDLSITHYPASPKPPRGPMPGPAERVAPGGHRHVPLAVHRSLTGGWSTAAARLRPQPFDPLDNIECREFTRSFIRKHRPARARRSSNNG